MKNHNEIFWGELAPCDHLLQIYESDDIFLHGLEGFTATGFLNGDAVILIGTDMHISAVEEKLKDKFDLEALKLSGQYIPYDVEEALSKFINNNEVDELKFREFISSLVARAKDGGRTVRAFGEMVAILWGQGNRKATIKLEQMWSDICQSDIVCLYCAYPQSGFSQDANDSFDQICSHHTKMVKENIAANNINLYGEKLSIFAMR